MNCNVLISRLLMLTALQGSACAAAPEDGHDSVMSAAGQAVVAPDAVAPPGELDAINAPKQIQGSPELFLLTGYFVKGWSYTHYFIDGEDSSALFPPCLFNNIATFNRLGVFAELEGVSKCLPGDPYVRAIGSWHFYDSNTKIYIAGEDRYDNGSGGIDTVSWIVDADILELTATALKIQFVIPEGQTSAGSIGEFRWVATFQP
jgi:hypothetical protein